MRCPRTICNLVAEFYILLCIDDDLLLTINRDDLGSAVRVTRVIDQPPKNNKKRIQRVMMTRGTQHVPEISLFRCIHYQVLIDTKQIAAADALSLVPLFTLIRHLGADDLPNVLDNHLST